MKSGPLSASRKVLVDNCSLQSISRLKATLHILVRTTAATAVLSMAANSLPKRQCNTITVALLRNCNTF